MFACYSKILVNLPTYNLRKSRHPRCFQLKAYKFSLFGLVKLGTRATFIQTFEILRFVWSISQNCFALVNNSLDFTLGKQN